MCEHIDIKQVFALVTSMPTFVAVPSVERFWRHLDVALEQDLAAARRANQIDDRFGHRRNCGDTESQTKSTPSRWSLPFKRSTRIATHTLLARRNVC